MKSNLLIIAVLAAVLVVGGAGAYALLSDHSQDTAYSTPLDLENTTPSQWSYMGGDMGSFGVTDAKTPITESEMTLAWKTTDAYMDQGGGSWKVPSSALCVEDSAFYFNGYDNSLYRCSVKTGEVIAKVKCESSTVFNMALAYGDGKIFLCAKEKTSTSTSTVLHAYNASTLEQLFVSVPVASDEVQGTITYHDGKVFFGTYSGNYACFLTTDTDTSKTDETVKPLWLIESDGWYNATPAFFGDMAVLVQRGFDTGGATAYLIDTNTGVIIDSVDYDREYSSSGATAYEGRVYIPLSKVIDRSILNPKAETPKHLSIHSYRITDSGFDRDTEKTWESDCPSGSTQSIPVIWNGSIYIGGGGLTTGSDEPFWIIDIKDDGSMETRKSFLDLKTKGTASITTAYATKENGYAVYIYLMEYGHVNPGEQALSENGYADIFVIRDSKTTGTEIVFTLRPDPAQFCFQSFSISKDGHVLIKNDTTLFCYGKSSVYTAEDVSSSISRFLSMSEGGHTNYSDYLRIEARYNALDGDDKSKVTSYQALQNACVKLTLKTMSGDKVLSVPKGSIIDIPSVAIPVGKMITGWQCNGIAWNEYRDAVVSDTVLEPVYADGCTVRIDPDNGDPTTVMSVTKGGKLPFINEPVRSGRIFLGWITDSDETYTPGESIVSSDLTLYAKWREAITLKFDTDGGSTISKTYRVETGKAIDTLPTTLKSGYSFIGWYYNDTQFTEDTIYTYSSAVTLKARWSLNGVMTKDNGNGISIRGQMPEDATMSAISPPNNGTAKAAADVYKTMMNAKTADCVRIYLAGDGVTPLIDYTVTFDVGSSHNGEKHTVIYITGNGTEQTQGTVTDGKLSFTVRGDKEGSKEITITIATATGLGITALTG